MIVRAPEVSSPGSDLTAAFAAELGRPCLVTGGDLEAVRSWLVRWSPRSLNVAGPRESEQPGIYRVTFDLVASLLGDH